MKQVSQSMSDGRIEVLDVPIPSLKPSGVLVRNSWSLISAGTEGAKLELGQKSLIAKARSRPDQARQVLDKVRAEGVMRTYRTIQARLEERSPIGYSCAGVVLQVGELARSLSVGDLVACGGANYANHAEINYVPATLCARVPDHVGLDQAAFATVGAVALQGVRQAAVSVGDRVAVLGLGLLGQIAVQLLRASGCEVAGSDPNADRCSTAVSNGATSATFGHGRAAVAELLAATGGVGYDAVIITAGTDSDEPVETAGLIARDRGVVVIVGDVGMHVPRGPYYEKELTLRLSRSYGPGRYDPVYEEMGIDYPIGYVRWTEQRNMSEFLRLVAEGRVDLASLITHRFTIGEAAEAYACVTDPGSESLGVLLEYPTGSPAPSPIRIATPRIRRSKAGSIGISFLGAGNFATATLIPALSKDSRYVPRGVYTPSGLSAWDVAVRYGFAFCADTIDEILSDHETEAVVIATRHVSHADLAMRAMRAGKAVFVEKPLAITEDELTELVEAQGESKGLLTVGFNRRFAPHVRKMVGLLSSISSPANILLRVNAGSIPPNHWIQRPEEGGGRIIGEVCHFIDLAACLAGSTPIRVYATSAKRNVPPLLVDDLTTSLTFDDGSVATIVYSSAGDTAYPKERIEVYCGGKVMVSDDFKRLSLTQGGQTHNSLTRHPDKGHVAELTAFLDAVAGRASEALAFEDCLASMTATFKVVESLTTGAVVRVPPVLSS